MAPSIDFAGWLAIFRTGKHTDSAGQVQAWTEADLDAIVANYNPSQYQAPIVLGHPTSDDPAWGWIAALKRVGDTLYAQCEQIVPEFADMVRKGLYSNRSVALDYTDKGWWLRHLGFLGAVPPAVKGLNAAAALSRPEPLITVEYHGRFPSEVLGRLLQNIREWLIGTADQETADRVLPAMDVDFLRIPEPEIIEVPALMPEQERIPLMAEPTTMTVTPEQLREQMDAAVKAALAAQRTELEVSFAAREQEREARVAQLEADRRRERNATLVEGLVKNGKLTPAQRSLGVVEFLCALETRSVSVQFADSQGKAQEQAPAAWFAAFLQALPTQVHFGEAARHSYGDASITDDPAEQYMARVEEARAKDGLTFAQAEALVQAQHPNLYDAYFEARQARGTRR